MFHQSSAREMSPHSGTRRVVSLLLWLSLTTGLAVSLFTVVEELCLATACRDTASFTFFGIGMGWLGIAYFSIILMLLWKRKKIPLLDYLLAAMVFSGIGAELRLLWIQKFIIGGWCPLCVSICCALCITAIALLVEKGQDAGSNQAGGKSFPGWLVFVLVMIASGLAIAYVGVKSL